MEFCCRGYAAIRVTVVGSRRPASGARTWRPPGAIDANYSIPRAEAKAAETHASSAAGGRSSSRENPLKSCIPQRPEDDNAFFFGPISPSSAFITAWRKTFNPNKSCMSHRRQEGLFLLSPLDLFSCHASWEKIPPGIPFSQRDRRRLETYLAEPPRHQASISCQILFPSLAISAAWREIAIQGSHESRKGANVPGEACLFLPLPLLACLVSQREPSSGRFIPRAEWFPADGTTFAR